MEIIYISIFRLNEKIIINPHSADAVTGNDNSANERLLADNIEIMADMVNII